MFEEPERCLLPPGGSRARSGARCGKSRLDVSRAGPEPVGVWLRDGKPARFVWRGRLYTVLAVLDRWTASHPRPVQTREPAPPDGGPAPESRPAAGTQPGPQPAANPQPQPVREFWRVEASPGKNVPPAAYELRHEIATDRWLLLRSWRQ